MKSFKRFLKNIPQVARNYRAFSAGTDHVIYEISKNDFSRLCSKYGSDKGVGGHGYARVYEKMLSKLRDEPVVVLEIGLLQHDTQRRIGGDAFRQAPSLQMLAEYFPKGRIIGFDIQDFSGFRHERCAVFRGDQSNRDDLRTSIAAAGVEAFDIIIDDALHASRHQQVSLAMLLPRLRSGGLYFIEDLHYQPDGFEAPSDRLTLDLLEELRAKEGFKSPVLSAAEIDYIERHVKKIAIFDTLKRKHEGKFALAVLEKV